jgi:photosynthetic reaction center cytochrome c subunit
MSRPTKRQMFNEEGGRMNGGWARTIAGALGATLMCLLDNPMAAGQAVPAQRPPMAEEVFKNVQVLKGIPVNEFMETMGFFSASLGTDCTFCHVAESYGNWEKFADELPRKQTARRMMRMMGAINQAYFDRRQVLTCYSCHRGFERPKVTPNLAALYAPQPEEPDDVVTQAPKAPPADQVLDKYLLALGGQERLSRLTSFVAKGTYEGYADTDKRTVEVFARAPAQRTTIVQVPAGERTTTYDGRNAWIAAPPADTPVPVVALAAGDLDSARLQAELSFPQGIKQAFGEWRVGLPATIDDREVRVVQGTGAGGSLVTLYFDPSSGLLVRSVHYADSPVGRLPTQTDYSDYREVAGVKMPFRWTVTWLDGRSTIQLTDVQPNVPVDAAKFARPLVPTPRR